MYFIVKLMKIMVIFVFFLVISVNRRLFRYFGSYSGYFGKSSNPNISHPDSGKDIRIILKLNGGDMAHKYIFLSCYSQIYCIP